jgi:hypothetical protein
MAENTDARNSRRKSIGADLVIPIAALLFTIYYFYTIINAPWTAQVAAFLVGSVLIILIVLFVVKCILQLRSGVGAFNFDTLVDPKSYLPKRISLLVLTTAYIFSVPVLGFTITTFLFLLMAMLVLSGGQKKRFIFFLALVLSLGGYALFIVAFKTRFPAGPFETFMKGFF